MTRLFLVAISATTLLAAQAEATTLTTLSFSGNVSSIYDGQGLFGASGTGYYSSQPISGTLSYDPTQVGTCSSTSYCAYTISAASNATETITFNGKTASFSVTGGTLALNSGGGNSEQIQLNSGTGPSVLSLSFSVQDTSHFFSSDENPALSFSSVATTSGQDSTDDTVSGHSDSIGFSISSVSATTTTTSTPEPASLVLLGSGLVGLGALCRRTKQSNTRGGSMAPLREISGKSASR